MPHFSSFPIVRLECSALFAVGRGLGRAGLAACALALGASAASADATLDKIESEGRISVGVIVSGPPFGYIDPATQEREGLNIDLANEIGERIGAEVELVSVTPPNRVQFLQQGRVDLLIANMSLTEERAEILDYVPTPYERGGGVAVTRKDSGIADWSDLDGQPVCVSQGSNFTKPLIEEYGAEVRGYPSQPESLLALRGGNCVAAVHVGATVRLMLEDRPEEWGDYHVTVPTELLPSDTVIWVRKGETDTRAALDEIMKDLHGSGRYKELAAANRLQADAFLEEQHALHASAAQ